MEFFFTDDKGNLILRDYDSLENKINNNNIESELVNIYKINGKDVNISRIDDYSDVFQVVHLNKSLTEYIIAKETTPGGRDNLKDEQRIQVSGKSLQYLYKKSEEGYNTSTLGLYKFFEKLLICAWKTNDSTSDNPISKQIKIECISAAINIGLVQQKFRNKELYSCAFLPEFLNFYEKYKDLLHTGSVESIISNQKMTIIDDMLLHCTEPPNVSRQLIFFGAPGTGKSNRVEQERVELLTGCQGNYERVTFHPDYSYAQFVGTYKPVPEEDNPDVITYKYVPGPFTRSLVAANWSPNQPQLLIIEEINRANIAGVFGDTFQLLDRVNGVSEYPITPSEDLKKYLSENLPEGTDVSQLRIPENLYIWATMNSADQGVYAMDTAFKRRWEFEYIGVNANEKVIAGYTFTLGEGDNKRKVNWNQLRRAINDFLLEQNVNEDKLLGPFFINPNILASSSDSFVKVFKNKILMYLFEDAAKSKRAKLFAGCSRSNLFSTILEEFDTKGVLIFDENIYQQAVTPSEEVEGVTISESGDEN